MRKAHADRWMMLHDEIRGDARKLKNGMLDTQKYISHECGGFTTQVEALETRDAGREGAVRHLMDKVIVMFDEKPCYALPQLLIRPGMEEKLVPNQ